MVNGIWIDRRLMLGCCMQLNYCSPQAKHGGTSSRTLRHPSWGPLPRPVTQSRSRSPALRTVMSVVTHRSQPKCIGLQHIFAACVCSMCALHSRDLLPLGTILSTVWHPQHNNRCTATVLRQRGCKKLGRYVVRGRRTAASRKAFHSNLGNIFFRKSAVRMGLLVVSMSNLELPTHSRKENLGVCP